MIPGFFAMSHAACSTGDPAASVTPVSSGNCDSAINTAAALIKPINTGCDRKFSSTPRRIQPSASWMTPESSASNTTQARNFSLPGTAIGVTLAAVSNELIATVPVDNCGEEPNKAPMTVG